MLRMFLTYHYYMGHCYKEASASEDMASCEIREEGLLDDNRGTEGA